MPVTRERLAQLEAYTGTNPIPEDFDAFWAERMAEADAVDLDWELSESDAVPQYPTCRYLDLWFRGMRGARLYAKVLMPTAQLTGTDVVPVVLRFHGYPGRTRSWLENSSFAGMGFCDITMDNPGQGGRSEDVGGFVGTTVSGHLVTGLDGAPQNLYYVRLHQDIRILCRVVRELAKQGMQIRGGSLHSSGGFLDSDSIGGVAPSSSSDSPDLASKALPGLDLSHVCVYGDSQGGGVGLATCALNPDLITCAGILYPFLSDFRRVWELGADQIAYEGIRYYSRWFDADGTGASEAFRKLGYIDTLSFAHLVRCPVLFGTGLADVVCPPETQFAVYNALAGSKRHLLYPDFGHEEIQAFDDELIRFFWMRGAFA